MQRFKQHVMTKYGSGEFDQVPINADIRNLKYDGASDVTLYDYPRKLALEAQDGAWTLLHGHHYADPFDKMNAQIELARARLLFSFDNPFKRL